jgi:CMP-N-acetylneuraminate monooxygenase
MMELRQLGALNLDSVQWRGSAANVAFAALEEGADIKVIVVKDATAPYGVAVMLDQCAHQGAHFNQDIEDGPDGACVITCPNHKWRLDVCTRKYVNPAQDLEQETLELTPIDTRPNCYDVYQFTPPDPWAPLAAAQDGLRRGEFSLEFVAHACVLLQGGETSLLTDPWLVGPAFGNSWWLGHAVDADLWLERAAQVDAIYISHSHEDHANAYSLRALAERNPDVRVLAGDVGVEAVAASAGLRNVEIVPFGEWVEIGPEMRLMILRDALMKEIDTCCVIDYKGHLVVNTNDCSRPNGNHLPDKNVDVLLTDFAGGSSCYPHCYLNYSDEASRALANQRCAKLLQKNIRIARQVRPKVYVPFAGFYSAAADPDLESRTVYNTPEKAVTAVTRAVPETRGWVPEHGAVLDVVTGEPLIPGYSNAKAVEWPVNEHRDAYELEVARLGPFDRAFYTGYVAAVFNNGHELRMNLWLRIVEMQDDSFDNDKITDGLFSWAVDLRTGTLHLGQKDCPELEQPTLTIWVRQTMLWHAMVHRSNWDFIDIGFNARLLRVPDR